MTIKKNGNNSASKLPFYALMAVLLSSVAFAEPSTVTRALPSSVAICSPLNVTLDVFVNSSDAYYVIDEIPPAGWNITNTGTGNNTTDGHLKWLVLSAVNTTYQYTVAAPCSVLDSQEFGGQYGFHSGSIFPIAGQTSVNVVDMTPPVITLLGSTPVTITVGIAYVDAGATAFDNYDGNLTANITMVNPVNISAIGVYNITYDVNDTSNNSANRVVRIVNVVAASAPTSTASSGGSGGSNNGGGSGGSGGGTYTGSNSQELKLCNQSLSVKRTVLNRTITLSVTNDGDAPICPFTLKEEIPYNLSASDVTFSVQPSSFESGSLIAVWKFDGLAAGNSYTIAYTLLTRNVGSLSNFKATASEQPKPEAKPVTNVPLMPSENSPVWTPTALPVISETPPPTNASTSETVPLAASATGFEIGTYAPIILLVGFVIIVALVAQYIGGKKEPPTIEIPPEEIKKPEMPIILEGGAVNV